MGFLHRPEEAAPPRTGRCPALEKSEKSYMQQSRAHKRTNEDLLAPKRSRTMTCVFEIAHLGSTRVSFHQVFRAALVAVGANAGRTYALEKTRMRSTFAGRLTVVAFEVPLNNLVV